MTLNMPDSRLESVVRFGFASEPPPDGGDDTLARARRAHERLHGVARTFFDKVQALRADTNLSSEGRRKSRRQLGRETLAELDGLRADILPRLRVAARGVSNDLGQVLGVFPVTSTENPGERAVREMRAGEIRAAIRARNQSPLQTEMEALQWVATGDEEALGAVLDAPEVARLLEPESRQRVLRALAEQRDPRRIDALERLTLAREALVEAFGIVASGVGLWAEITDGDRVDAAANLTTDALRESAFDRAELKLVTTEHLLRRSDLGFRGAGQQPVPVGQAGS